MHFKTLYISFLLFLSLLSHAQLKIENLALTKPDANFLYIGVDNKIEVSGVKNTPLLRVEMNGMFYSADVNGLFYVKAVKRDTSELHVYQNSKIVATKIYYTDRIPEPIVLLGAYRDTVVLKGEVLNYNKLRVVFPNCLYSHKSSVASFDIKFISKIKELNKSDKVYGTSIPEVYKSLISKLQSGDKIVFDNIRIVGPDDLIFDSFYILLK